MKKTIALVLALVLTLSLAAMPASAATNAILDGYCTQCGEAAYYFSQSVLEPRYDHMYMEGCLDIFEPHYHSLFARYDYVMCANPDCISNGYALLLEGPIYYDVCHYWD